jgi:hypothetical protein
MMNHLFLLEPTQLGKGKYPTKGDNEQTIITMKK